MAQPSPTYICVCLPPCGGAPRRWRPPRLVRDSVRDRVRDRVRARVRVRVRFRVRVRVRVRVRFRVSVRARADDEVHEEEGADEGERDKVDQRVGVVLDVRLQVDAARVGAREHEAAPAVEEHALEEREHGVGCRVEVLRRHLVMGRWREM